MTDNKPVAWILNGILHEFDPSDWAKEQYPDQDVIPLYTHPAKTLTEILATIKLIADDIGGYKEYENTYEDGWLDACNTVYDEVFAILKKAQEK